MSKRTLSAMEHTRIDEGIKRKARKRRPAYRRNSETGIAAGMPPDANADAILQRYLFADTSSQVARELGVRRSTLSQWLRDTCPEKWHAVQVIRADLRKEDGDSGIYGARDALDLARARELLRSAQWDLERLDPKNYAQKQELSVAVDLRVQVDHQLTDSARELIQRMRGVVALPDKTQQNVEQREIEEKTFDNQVNLT